MLDPDTLFSFEPHIDPESISARTLIVTLGTQHLDAGHLLMQVDDRLLNGLPNRLLGSFDADQILDYGSERPSVIYDQDHFRSYEAPKIALHEVTDLNGTTFLLLSGPEPRLQWERTASAVTRVADRLHVEQTVIVESMPAPVPHTRPTPITQYSGENGEPYEHAPIPAAFQFGANFTSLLTIRLSESRHRVGGLIAHVPQYLAQAVYPAAVLATLATVDRVTGLTIPVGELPAAASEVERQAHEQISQSEQLQSMVAQLEDQYDRFSAGDGSLAAEAFAADDDEGDPLPQDLPDAEEIGSEVEDFLRGLDNGSDASD